MQLNKQTNYDQTEKTKIQINVLKVKAKGEKVGSNKK